MLSQQKFKHFKVRRYRIRLRGESEKDQRQAKSMSGKKSQKSSGNEGGMELGDGTPRSASR